MITTNISGAALTAAYEEAVKADSRDWLVKILKDGNEVSCSIKRLEVLKGSCGSTEFSVGNLFSATLTARLLGLAEEVKGEEVEVQVGLFVDTDYEWISLGLFKISDVEKTIYETILTGYGRIVSKTGGDFIEPTTKTLARIAREIGVEMGCTVEFESGIDTSLEIAAPMNNLTTYQALQVLASVVGGYAIETPSGNVKICRYKDDITAYCNSGQMVSLPAIEAKNPTITGIRCIVSEASSDDEGDIPAVGFESGSPVNLVMQNEYMTQALFDDMAADLIGYTYRPGSLDLSLGDPRLEGTDAVSVTDADESTYIMPCHSVKHIYDGGLHTQIIAVPGTAQENDIGTKTPFQRLLSGIKSSIISVRSIAEKAKTIAGNTAQYFWFTSTGTDTGAHITEIPQEDFLQDPANGGGNLLARSNGVAVRDGLTELAQFGADGIVVGQQQSFHNYLEIDYHSMRLVDRDGNDFFYVSDLRDAQGRATITEEQEGSPYRTVYTVFFDVITNGIVSVLINGVETTAYTQWGIRGITLDTAPAKGDIITITYITVDDDLKAYTAGIRESGSIIGANSFVEGYKNTASGYVAHAEGNKATAKGHYSHAEGLYTEASGECAHAEGNKSKATGFGAHAEGYCSEANGEAAHAGGGNAIADGNFAFAHGEGAEAEDDHMTALGCCNATKTGALVVGKGQVWEKIGGVITRKTESDALTLDWSGNLAIAGSLTQSSDRRLKDHISYLGEDAEDFIRALKPAHYRKDDKDHVGFYAQDVEEADTWHCMTGELNGFKTLDYTEIIAPLVAYCQSLEKRIEELERGTNKCIS